MKKHDDDEVYGGSYIAKPKVKTGKLSAVIEDVFYADSKASQINGQVNELFRCSVLFDDGVRLSWVSRLDLVERSSSLLGIEAILGKKLLPEQRKCARLRSLLKGKRALWIRDYVTQVKFDDAGDAYELEVLKLLGVNGFIFGSQVSSRNRKR